MANAFDDSFNCNICQDIAENAAETTCCHQLYCWSCLTSPHFDKTKCPSCRQQPLQYQPSVAMRRVIANLPRRCPYQGCNVQVPRGDIETHKETCPFKSWNCPAPTCCYAGKPREFMQHIMRDHEDIFLKNASRLFETRNPMTSMPERREELNELQHQGDLIAPKLNENGRMASLGLTGKHYCGAPITCDADCIDGIKTCGPMNGCNCAACMLLDIKCMRLPPGYLVNNNGAPARRATNGLFYCGREQNRPEVAGIFVGNTVLAIHEKVLCGPDDGRPCRSCQMLHRTTYGMYRGLVDYR